MDIFLQTQTWVSLLALTGIEIILGVDNLVFIAIVTGKLPQHRQKLARRVGLSMAMLMRLLLLASIVWLAEATVPFMHIAHFPVSIRTLILFLGGLFLVYKSIHELLSLRSADDESTRQPTTFFMAILQIMVFDIIFSLDSVITAIGVVQEYEVMAIAIILAVLLMLLGSEPIMGFIMRHARVKILALAVLILVGIKLMLGGLGFHIPSAYLYVTMAFALFVELINIYIKPKN
jgi:predicted tellurium resistance membrane protein TerC